MFVCPTCGYKNHEGALFCDACGAYFHTGGPLATNAIGADKVSRSGPSGFPQPNSPAPGADTVLVLTSDDGQLRFVVDARLKTVLLGRSDRKSRFVVDVDLTGEDGQAYGISRRHARAHFSNGTYLLEDLESLNGTTINGRKLRPYLPEVIHDGDEIRLGSLVLRAAIEPPGGPPPDR